MITNKNCFKCNNIYDQIRSEIHQVYIQVVDQTNEQIYDNIDNQVRPLI